MSLTIFTILVFIHAFFWLAWKLDKFTIIDVGWGLGFILVAVVSYLQSYPSTPKLLLLAMVVIWGMRLSLHLYHRTMSHPEDPRYQAMRDEWGADFLKLGYKKIFLAQGLAMFVISLPVQVGMSSDLLRLGSKQYLGFSLWLLGFLLEVWADSHLKKFKANQSQTGAICTTGPWAFCRFPNYLGEILIWWGIYLYIFGFWTAWTIVGPLLISYSLLKVTGIPLLEKRFLARPGYREYALRVPRLIPFTRPRLPEPKV